jgi:alanyl-tRNA synthetase
MTERLYYGDAYLADFTATVVDRAVDGRRIYLDRTAFYPTSGGQQHDLGTLSGVEVIDVIDEGDRIAHLLAGPVNDALAHGLIDWPRRFDHMQQHTGQHLLSAIFSDAFGHATVSVHFGDETSTLDLDCEHVADGTLRDVERRANEIVIGNRAVRVSFTDEGAATGLRKATGRTGTLRIVEIDGMDRSACGGTHVRSTAEVGVVLLRRQERVRKAARVEFVCGHRAVRRARRDLEALAQMAHELSSSLDGVPDLVRTQAEQLRDAEGRIRRLESALSEYRARERFQTTDPDERGLRRSVERHATGSPDEWRALATAYCALPKTAFIGASEDPPAVLLAVSDDTGIDAGKTLRAALQEVGGRGGGSPRLAQGSVPSADALERVLRSLGEVV